MVHLWGHLLYGAVHILLLLLLIMLLLLEASEVLELGACEGSWRAWLERRAK